MKLKQYINVLLRRKWVILITLTVTMIAVGVSTHTQTPKYRTSTILRIATSTNSTLSYSDYVQSTQLINTYVEIASSSPILDEVKTQLNLKTLPIITVETIPNTELIEITAESVFPELTAKVANSLAEILMSESRELYSGGGKSSQEILEEQLKKAEADLQQTRDNYAKLIIQTPAATGEIEVTGQLLQVTQSMYLTLLGQYTQATLRDEIRSSMVTMIEPALVPQTPFEPRPSLNYALGFAVGLMGGLGLAFLFESQDTALYSSENIEAIVEINEIAKIPKTNRKQLSNFQDNSSELANAFRNLAINLQSAKDQPPKQVLLVMSAEPKQGKSMLVHRLAHTFTDEFGKKVVAIDCDNHMPKLHLLFGLSNNNGLTSVLEEKTDLREALQTSPLENTKLLASGYSVLNYPKLLASPKMVKLLDDLKSEFDYVLLDTSTLLDASDIASIVPMVDNVLLVVRREHAHREALHAMKRILAGLRFRDKPVALIINQAEAGNSYNRHMWHRNLVLGTKQVEVEEVL